MVSKGNQDMLECPGGKNNSIVSVKLNAFISVKIVLCSSAILY